MIQHMSRHICMSIKPMTKVACLLLLKKRIALIHIAGVSAKAMWPCGKVKTKVPE
jgi:hypothetical protein